MKKLLEFTLDNGETIFIEVVEENKINDRQTTKRSVTNTESSSTVSRSFNEALRVIAPTANTLLNSLKDINKPDEIKLEFGLTFNAKAGVVFTSAESEASFKVGVTWKK